jgi:hypothetical protein
VLRELTVVLKEEQMKKILYSIAITVFLTANIHAQTTPGVWGRVPNAGLDPRISDMVFVTDTVGYIYGSFSNPYMDMQRTNDSGVDFNQLTIQTPIRSPNFVSNMAWSTTLNGDIIADTGIFPNPTSTFSIHSSDGGTTWTTSKIDSSLQIGNMYFPSATTGYGTGSLPDGSATFVAKTTDGGATWKSIYSSENYSSFGKLYFINENNGMFFAVSESNTVVIGYTTNGGTSFSFAPLATDSTPNFLYWNKDSSWLVGADSVYRSIDSGKKWTSVAPYDDTAGPATVGAFYDDTGFIFRSIEPIVLMTTDAGLSWTSSRLPNNGGSSADSVTPLAASMPSAYECYLLGADNSATTDALLKIAFTPPTVSGGGGSGVVQTEPVQAIPFAAVYGSNAITFTMAPASEARSIQILDVLGRTCQSISLPANAMNSQLATSALRPGTYFAQLSGSVVKFAIP